MMIDEFYFHHKRGLKKWESLGHPIDSFFFLITFLFCLTVPYQEKWTWIFITLSVVSTLIITKDEWIHSEQCSGAENWLHAMLFIIHPIALAGLYYAWTASLQNLILVQTIIITIFFLYQLIYWNFPKKGRYETRS